jgi:predicted SprT family Zn-dependent metalloprotease
MSRARGIADAVLAGECRRWCLSLGHAALADVVQVFWNPRMRTAAGRAFWPARVIEMNPVLHRFGAEEIDRTLKHELAHLVAYERAGRRRIEPHGAEWMQACAELGISGERATHKLPLERRRIERKYAYVCTHCFAVLRRARPLRRAVACAPCCKTHNGGRYDARFRLVPIKKPPTPP